MRIIVDKMPENGDKCCFGETVQMTSRVSCMFQKGMYSRCNLDCNMACKYLVDMETLEKEKKIQKLHDELDFLQKLESDGLIDDRGYVRCLDIISELACLEKEVK